MPFDAMQTTVLPIDSPERWSVNPNAITRPRYGFRPCDDNLALYIVGQYLKSRWAKRLNDGPNHCIVGWVVDQCEPNTTFNLGEPGEQTQRLLKRLHDALPKSARRTTQSHAWTLARYNDTHQHKAMLRVCERAYKMLVNETWGNGRNGKWPYPDVARWAEANQC